MAQDAPRAGQRGSCPCIRRQAVGIAGAAGAIRPPVHATPQKLPFGIAPKPLLAETASSAYILPLMG